VSVVFSFVISFDFSLNLGICLFDVFGVLGGFKV
jgi:hypothetical protein